MSCQSFRKLLVVVFASFTVSALVGCAIFNPPRMNTGSGKPEITIKSSQKMQFIADVNEKMQDGAFTLTDDDSNRMVFERDKFISTGERALATLLGGENSRTRVIYNFLPPKNNKIRVVVEVLHIDANNTTVSDVHLYPVWQDSLNKLGYSTTQTDSARPAGSVTDTSPGQIKNKSEISNMTTLQVQQKLFVLGYDVGKPDGVFGKKTSEALKKYQSDNGLTVTGRIDRETVQKMK